MSDLIERQAVDDAIYEYSRSCDVNYAQIMEYIEKIPSVSTETDSCNDEELDFVQPHKKIKVNLVKFDTPYYTDAISRQAAIDAMREETCGCCWDAKDILKHLPSVSTEKTGRWEWVQYDFDPNLGNWHCSECRNILVHAVKKDDVGGIPIAKYCQNCGAKMEVDE